MKLLSLKSVYEDEVNGITEQSIDDITLNIDEVSSFNPSTEEGHTTVTMKNGISYELVCGYEEFLGLIIKYSDLPIVRINCN